MSEIAAQQDVLPPDLVNTLRSRKNGRHFADDPFKRIFLNENVWISLKISLKFVPKVRINNIPALVPIMAWSRSGDKPLSELMLISLLTHICVTQLQWVKSRSREIRCKTYSVALKYDRRICSTSADGPVKFQSDGTNLNIHLAA